MHAAAALRRDGFTGRITMVDADPHPPYDKPPLSKQVLAGSWEPERIALLHDEPIDADHLAGTRLTGLDCDTRTVHLDGPDGPAQLTYDGLVIATGAAARRIGGTPDLAGIHVVRSLDDCLGLRADLDRGPSRVAVIGAGFIGAEVAATCRGRDLDVTIIEALPVPMERVLGPQIGQLCADLHRDHGVDVRLGVGVEAIEPSTDDPTRVGGVRLADGSFVEAEVVVVGIGVAVNTGWLEGSGLLLDDGVVVDETLLAAPGVVAAGDIMKWPSARYGQPIRVEHWEHAILSGEAAAKRLMVAEDEEAEVFDPVPWFWSDQYDKEFQLSGRATPHDKVEVVLGSTDERRFVALYGYGDKVVAVLGMNRPRHVMQLRKLVAEGASWDEGLAAAAALA
jgi:NADPH-dependent 2,4-dienoyl-CoA reductase/sulfur reductase-like enzyme